jgi:hypothetical protein
MIASPSIIRAVNSSYRDFKITMVKDSGLAPFITGEMRKDIFMHWLKIECGIYVEPIEQHRPARYKIVDEEKYAMFVLKWS